VQKLEVKYVQEVLVPYWEDEFVDELMDLLVTDEEDFDPLSDLKLIEDLLYNQMPSVRINKKTE